MRLSQLFGKTQRQPPAEAETPSHRLLLQTGLVAQISAGVFEINQKTPAKQVAASIPYLQRLGIIP